MKISESLSSYMHGRDNNFNLIRFIAASLVVVSHSFVIYTGDMSSEPFKDIFGMYLGTMCVDIFFITSGFLISASFLNRKSLITYIESRALRIYPGLIGVVLLTVFIIGPITTEDVGNYFSSSQTWSYLLRTSTLVTGVEYSLPGVFTNNPAPNQINSSLWTLPYEISMYMLVPALITVAIFLKKKVKISLSKILFPIWLASFTFFITAHYFSLPLVTFLKLFYMFLSGAVFYISRDKILLSNRLFVLFLLCTSASVFISNTFMTAYALFLPYLILYLAYKPTGSVRKFNRLEDYSYGIYIYGFPVQQLLILTFDFQSTFTFIAASLLATILPAYMSWHAIEKPALKLKRSNKKPSPPRDREQILKQTESYE